MKKEIEKRRTFAIVSHPDAGKTTITEKFLWYGNVIREAGHVRAKANRSHTTSDWMKIEQQRGISVSSSVLNFPHGKSQFNLLDTPGHQDFSEDTYRALTAVDSALVLLDSVNGVERQTIKLMDVCRLRKTPIITFINKMDLDGKDAIDLIDEIEDILKIKCAPFSLPIGYGKLFQGVYSILDDTLHTYTKNGDGQEIIQLTGIRDPKLDEMFEEKDVVELRDRYDLVTGVMEPFDKDAFLRGDQCPVFYGSAIANFGVKQLLDTFERLAPAPLPRETDVRVVDPYEENFSGFIFKIQANMDPKHRDRTAFMRVCSGKFQRGEKVVHCRTGKKLSMAAPTSFMAKNKEVVDTAYAGDIVGINDPGLFNIGDTLTSSEQFKFHGIPHFAPEYFAKVLLDNPLKSKQMKKGLDQLSEEGATQLFQPVKSPIPIIGVVGELQFDVLKHRLEGEYQAMVTLERFNVFEARWIVAKEDGEVGKSQIKAFEKEHAFSCSTDKEGNLVCLFPNEFKLNLAEKNFEGLVFEKTMES